MMQRKTATLVILVCLAALGGWNCSQGPVSDDAMLVEYYDKLGYNFEEYEKAVYMNELRSRYEPLGTAIRDKEWKRALEITAAYDREFRSRAGDEANQNLQKAGAANYGQTGVSVPSGDRTPFSELVNRNLVLMGLLQKHAGDTEKAKSTFEEVVKRDKGA